jgi:hypothetical protein
MQVSRVFPWEQIFCTFNRHMTDELARIFYVLGQQLTLEPDLNFDYLLSFCNVTHAGRGAASADQGVAGSSLVTLGIRWKTWGINDKGWFCECHNFLESVAYSMAKGAPPSCHVFKLGCSCRDVLMVIGAGGDCEWCAPPPPARWLVNLLDTCKMVLAGALRQAPFLVSVRACLPPTCSAKYMEIGRNSKSTCWPWLLTLTSSPAPCCRFTNCIRRDSWCC